MPNKKLIPVLALALVASLGAQQEGKISARDVFRSAKDMFDFQQKSAPAKKPAAKKPARRPPAPAPPKEVVTNTPAPTTPAPPRPEPPITPADEPQVINAALINQPLGLRYSILKKTPSGEIVEIDSESSFQSGDSIRVTVESSDIAYLYIVNKGSSGRWNVLFPSKGIAGGANRVEPDYRYVIPPGGWFTFDEQVGEEDLFILLSRTPVDDLEKEIYELSGDDSGTPDASPADEPKVMMASASPVADSTIDGYRKVYSRDLVFEKVDDEAAPGPVALSGAKAEKAVYVVTKSGGRDARVVADLKLVHK